MGQKVWNIDPTPQEEAAARERRRLRREAMVKRVRSYAPLLIAVLLVSSAAALVSMELRLRTPDDDTVGVFKFRHVRHVIGDFGNRARMRINGSRHGGSQQLTGGVG